MSSIGIVIPWAPLGQGAEMIDTAILPTSVQQVISGSGYVLQMVFVNYVKTGSPTITLTDGNGNEFVFVGVAVTVGIPVSGEWPEGHPFVGGLNWQCDTANAVKGKIVFRR